MRIRLFLVTSLLLVILASSGCAASPNNGSNFNRQLNSIMQPYSFNFITWEINTFLNDLKQNTVNRPSESNGNSQSVVSYFSYIAQLNTLKSDMRMLQAKKIQGDMSQYEARSNEVQAQITALKPIVEQTIASQINQVLSEQGIYNPFNNNWFKITFPPVNFRLEKPLYELIISPRDKIQRTESITIKPDITVSQMEEIESSVDKLNVSALVVQIGGLGATYPSFVVNNADLRRTIDTAAHEWLHQYLAFKPLGFRYILDLLGISKNYKIGTINETVASVFGQEIGNMVYNQYYSQYQTNDRAKERSPVTPGFDFSATMREIRQNVDAYLAQGQVDQAEKYMNDQQQYLASKGYYIRKLNQAYFAFYGTYADSPTSVDPIGSEISLLRKNSSSLKGFLDTVSTIKSSQDLTNAVSNLK